MCPTQMFILVDNQYCRSLVRTQKLTFSKMRNFCALVLVLCSIFSDRVGHSTPIVNIAVIGAGPSGLIATKRAVEKGFNVTIYEQNEVVGGLWYYTDEIGKNKYGIDIHTAAYKDLQ